MNPKSPHPDHIADARQRREAFDKRTITKPLALLVGQTISTKEQEMLWWASARASDKLRENIFRSTEATRKSRRFGLPFRLADTERPGSNLIATGCLNGAESQLTVATINALHQASGSDIRIEHMPTVIGAFQARNPQDERQVGGIYYSFNDYAYPDNTQVHLSSRAIEALPAEDLANVTAFLDRLSTYTSLGSPHGS